MAKVSLHIVSWNSMRFLPDALQSIAAQTFRDIQVIVVDNASTDGVEEYIRAHHPEVIFLRNFKNLGFAKAHNQAIELARSLWAKQESSTDERFVLVTNPDILLTPTYLETILAATTAHPEAASFGGTLFKIFEKQDGEFSDAVRSTMIDTTGIKLFRTGRVVERGAGEQDQGQYRTAGDVFGFSGALGLYRIGALEDIRMDDDYFDTRFFAYKEDIDLAWRLRLRGWHAWFVPDAKAYHYRGAYGSEKRKFRQAWKERRAKSSIVNRLSYRNHFWLLLKNLDVGMFLLHSFWILPYEFLKFWYVLFLERGTLQAVREAILGIPDMFRKRRQIQRMKKVKSRDVRKWFV
jgi:GT2 family glycosyltransferase